MLNQLLKQKSEGSSLPWGIEACTVEQPDDEKIGVPESLEYTKKVIGNLEIRIQNLGKKKRVNVRRRGAPMWAPSRGITKNV